MGPIRRAARRPGVRRVLRLGVDRVPLGRDRLLGLARSLDSLVFRSERTRATGPSDRRETLPATYRISPAPPPVDSHWPTAPLIDEPHKPVRSIGSEVALAPAAFDIDLFEALNAEYEAKPIVPKPPGRDAASRSDKARKRLESIHQSIGLANQRVLEFGCGAGYEVWYLAHHLGADATGVDVVQRRAWSVLANDRTHFVMADLAKEQPYEANTFDRIVSFSVFEHVAHPYAALRELHRILRPGGLAFISANLHRGPMASHHYHDVYFPWPHLLFTDGVFREFFERRGRTVHGASWVNRLTWAEYENHFWRIGFEMLSVRFSESGFDEDFYRRFESVLGRYPRWDLSRDFFHVVVRKP
jgi:cyclopropane fatty-acyl-phospholipid synthase-like methyltransferase